MTEYLDTVREIERRIILAEKQNAESGVAVPTTPAGVPDDHETHTKLMFDLMAIAFQADITRVSTFMMAREQSATGPSRCWESPRRSIRRRIIKTIPRVLKAAY